MNKDNNYKFERSGSWQNIEKQQFRGGFPGGTPGGSRGGFPGGTPGGSRGGFPGGTPGGSPGGFPGGAPGGSRGGFPAGAPGGSPGQPPAGMRRPMTAPPNFTPELPGTNTQPFSGRDSRDGGLGRGSVTPNFFRRHGDFRECMYQFTFVWLFNGNSFWFFPVNVRRSFVEGFRWRGNRWVLDRVNTNRVLYYRCF